MKNVLVIGAGPVGLAMAAELARYGVSVRIVDKAAQRTDKSKALVIWSRTLELMDRSGCGRALVAAGLKVSAVNIVAGKEQIAHVSLSSVVTPHPYGLMLPQSETERLLEQHLSGYGVQVERGVELITFKDSGTDVASTLRDANGKEETVTATWLIGCDGAHSTVRHQLGMEFVGRTLTSDWILADVHLSGVPNPEDVNLSWHSDGMLAIFPLSHDRFRVIADVGEDQDGKLRPDPTLDEVQAVLDRRGPGGIRTLTPVWLAAFRINERKVANYRSGRAFLAGDAAHIHSPAGGQGMNTGIQDACNLAWKLALVCRGIGAPGPLLDSYSVERSAVGEQVLKNAGRLTTIGIMKGGIKQSLRNHVASLMFGLSPIRQRMADAVTELSIGYPDSPLTVPGSHGTVDPAAGERAPVRDNEAPIGAGDTPRFVLCAAAGDAAAKLVAQYPDLLDPAIRSPFAPGGAWLIRPDGYTAIATRAENLTEIAAFLDSLHPDNPA